jgi:localization factor PodJL
MATSLPWNVKGVDPRTRDAARAAARRAGMSLGEWLDSVIRDEAADNIEAETNAAADELEALSERLSRLNQGDMDTAAFAGRPVKATRLTAVPDAPASRKAGNSEERTAAALDSIARWIEKTEQRLSSSERVTAERQERATSVVADAIKTIGSRIAEIERRDVAPAETTTPAAMRNGRPVLSRESLASAVSDIRLRQRDLDSGQGSETFKLPDQLSQRANSIRHEPLSPRGTQAEDLLASLKQDLKELGARIGTGPVNTGASSDMQDLRNDLSLLRNDVLKLARTASTSHIETAIRDLSTRLQQGGGNSLETLTRPLSRIEAEIARLSDSAQNPAHERIESELAHIGGRIDALASRGSDGHVLAAATRELSAIRDLVADATGASRLEELAGQLSSLSGDVSHVRENQVKGRDIETLREAISDMRQTMAQGQQPPQQDGGAMIGLSRQIEALSGRIDALPSLKSGEIDAKITRLVQQFDSHGAAGKGGSDAVANRIEALVIKLEDLAERAPARMEGQIESLSERLELLANRAATPEGSSRLERQIEGMTSALEVLATQSAAPKTSPQLERQIEAMAARLESLADSNRLTQVVAKSDGKTTIVDMRPLEDMVRSLSQKLDEAQSPGADNATLAALEKQVGKLAEKLDIAAAARADNGLETTLQGLIAHFKGLQSETTAAAERAAREALTSEFRRVERQDTGGIAKLSEAVSSLQVRQDTTGQQTNTALDAVHETLERIVSRLGTLEGELTRDSAMPVSAPPRKAVAAPIPAALAEKPRDHASFERRVAANAWPTSAGERVERRSNVLVPTSDTLDTPLEPGSGRPKPAGATSEFRTTAPTIPAPAAPAADLRNIIAAARRAAQTVKAEAASAQAEVVTPGKRGAKAGPGLKETLEKRRKPLLLGLAAIVLGLGATHVVLNGRLNDAGLQLAKPVVSVNPATEAVPASKNAASEPAVEKNATETAPLPSKDQNSVLSPSLVAPAQPAAPFVRQIDTTASADTTSFVANKPASGTQTAALPEANVAGLKDLPANLGTPGLRKAALGGDARAVYELAVRAADGAGSARDPKTAIKLFERAAGAGLAPAQFRLGNMFEKGIGAPRDVTLARLWYERAAEKGNAKAMHNLAVLYAEGATGKPDYTMAVEWFKKASEHGMRDSQFNLGVLLARGLGTEQSLVQSWTWFAVGAAQGDDDAAKKRDEVGIKLSPTELAAAKVAVSQWKPKSADPSANEVVSPAQGWDNQPGQPQTKPAKAKSV